MPPKKREKEAEGQKVPRMDQIQADHELFLQAFESEYIYDFFFSKIRFLLEKTSSLIKYSHLPHYDL